MNASQLRADVEMLAAPVGRLVGSPGHYYARQCLVRRLAELELRPLVGTCFEIPYTYAGEAFCNLSGVAPAEHATKGPPVLIGAHYDSALAAPCADDNLAAVAIALAVAAEFRTRPAERDLVVALFDAEESPYFKTQAMGSIRLYEEHLRNRGVHAAILMDLVGHDVPLPLPGASLLGLGNLLFMSGAESHPALAEVVRAAPVPQSLLPVATLNRNIGREDGTFDPPAGYHYDLSDQYVFRVHGVPYFFFSCGHWPHYHQESDTPEKLNYEKMARTAEYLATLLRGLAAAQLPVVQNTGTECDTVPLELELIERAFGKGLPLLLRALGLGPLKTRADLDRLAARVQGKLGV